MRKIRFSTLAMLAMLSSASLFAHTPSAHTPSAHTLITNAAAIYPSFSCHFSRFGIAQTSLALRSAYRKGSNAATDWNHTYSQKMTPDTTIMFAQRDTCNLYMDIYQPDVTKAVSEDGLARPTVIHIFGGGFMEGDRHQEWLRPWFRQMNSMGYRMISIDYRLGLKGVRGVSQSEFAILLDKAIHIAVKDLFSATEYLVRNGASLGIDADNLVVTGSSAGAITAQQAEYEICNATPLTTFLPKGFNYRGIMAFAGAVLSNGPLSYAAVPCPIMMFHGTDDELVPYDLAKSGEMYFNGACAIQNALKDAAKSCGTAADKANHTDSMQQNDSRTTGSKKCPTAIYRLYHFPGINHAVAGYMPQTVDKQVDFIERNVMRGSHECVDAIIVDSSLPTYKTGDPNGLYDIQPDSDTTGRNTTDSDTTDSAANNGDAQSNNSVDAETVPEITAPTAGMVDNSGKGENTENSKIESARQQDRWTILPDRQGIIWDATKGLPHEDHLEMSGEKVSCVLRWGVAADGSFHSEKSLVFPMLRTIPNNTHASLNYRVATDIPSMLSVNGRSLINEKVESVRINGMMEVTSLWSKANDGIGVEAAAHAASNGSDAINGKDGLRSGALRRTPIESACIRMTRTIFPSTTLPAIYERFTLKNVTGDNLLVDIPQLTQIAATDHYAGVDGTYLIRTEIAGNVVSNGNAANGEANGNNSETYDKNGEASSNNSETYDRANSKAIGAKWMKPGEERTFTVIYQAYREGGTVTSPLLADSQPVTRTVPAESPLRPDTDAELNARESFVEKMGDNLILETPDTVLNEMLRFAKIRAAESIYRTKGGLMHGPGGESYYAAIWANDQAEYVNPFFPFLGYDKGNESALNSFRHFARFINDDYKPIPSSIIAEGDDIWNGCGDRGDAAMIAYGASRYALARGDKSEAHELWPLIQWCLEYCRRNLNEEGVVRSDTDELENRFESGDANLCTSTLYYDALLSAASLGQELGEPRSVTRTYISQAKKMASSIEKYFGGNVSGYETYRYYKGNTRLRSWICMPLIAGISTRAAGTTAALTGPELMTENGCLTEQGSDVFWDRATLYALRGIFYTGGINRNSSVVVTSLLNEIRGILYTAGTDKALGILHNLSERRLLGDHVPYAVEAWPEGSQRHLSAESGLYCRVITEGLFGIRPTGFHSFTMNVSLPSGWNRMALRHIRAFDSDFDIEVFREDDGSLKVTLIEYAGSAPSNSADKDNISGNTSNSNNKVKRVRQFTPKHGTVSITL